MDTKTLSRQKRHARRLAQQALRRAGPRKKVAKALGKSLSAISHEVTDRCNPDLERAFSIMVALADDDVSLRAFVEAVNEAAELRDLVRAETTTLIARGLWLIEAENMADAAEDNASLQDQRVHAEALRDVASKAGELAMIEEELTARRVDLLALYREGNR